MVFITLIMKRARELDESTGVSRDHYMEPDKPKTGALELKNYDRRNNMVKTAKGHRPIDIKFDFKQRALIFHNGLTNKDDAEIGFEWFVSPLFSEMNQLDWCFLDSIMKCYHAKLYTAEKLGGDKTFRGTFYHRNIMVYKAYITYREITGQDDTETTLEKTNLQSIDAKEFMKKYFDKNVDFTGPAELMVDFEKINSMAELVDLLSPNWLHSDNAETTGLISKISASCVCSPIICLDGDVTE